MLFHFNVFRILADLTHLSSKAVLLWSIHRNRSAEGVSLITQTLYAAVFCIRYLDLFEARQWSKSGFSAWNLVFKLLYISSSLYIIYVMIRVFKRSREREKAWKFGAACLAGSAVAAPFMMMIFEKKDQWGFFHLTRAFSELLEAVCVLPQLLLLRQTAVPTVIDSFYLLLLGGYRVLYVLNWIVRSTDPNDHLPPVDVICGVAQVLLYLDFAWVYYSRQRVKLRNGAVVDGQDMSRGYLVGKILGRRSVDADEGDEDATERGWAGRGISISADEETIGSRPQPKRYDDQNGQAEERSSMMHGEQEEVDFDDEEVGRRTKRQEPSPHEVTSGEEWRQSGI